MMRFWVVLAVAAGGLQSLRTAMQHSLRGRISLNSAALIRHLFGLPFVLAFGLAYVTLTGHSWDRLGTGFSVLVLEAGSLQLFGTICLIRSFSDRGYLVGSAFAKTEAVQAALVAAVVLGEKLGAVTWCGILVSVAGIMILALWGRLDSMADLIGAMTQPAAAYGLGAAGLLAATGLIGKEATALVETSDPITAALVTVGSVMAVQIVLQGGWMALCRPGELRVTLLHWRESAMVGLVSAAGSIAWFASLALAPVALVRIVGQTEALFTIGLAHGFLGERPRRSEVVGLVIVVLGVALALWGTSQN